VLTTAIHIMMLLRLIETQGYMREYEEKGVK